MRDVEIRLADPADAREIAELHIRSFRTAYEHLPLTRRSAERGLNGRVVFWEDCLRRTERTTLIAVEDGRFAGFINFGPSSDVDAHEATGHIFSLHVDPELTGTGVGGRLVDAAVTALSNAGYDTATLWVVGENERARRFYSRLGWRTDGAVRTEKLAVGDEEGDDVDVVRFRLSLRVA